MDGKTRKLVEAQKALKNELEEIAYKNREAMDRCAEDSFYQGFYNGKAEGLEDAALLLGKKVAEWAEECIG